MEFTVGQIHAILGEQLLEMIAARMTVQQQAARIAELEAKYEPKPVEKPKLEAVAE